MSKNDDEDANNRSGEGIPEFIEGRAESEALVVKPLQGKLLADRYRVENRVGEGGFGAVYRGHDEVTSRTVGIKFLLHTMGRKAKSALARFQREAEITARLNHPFILTIYDVGIHEGCPYIVMEWVQGKALSDLVKQGPVDWRTLIKILGEVASALTHGAAQGVVHRDMKPDNVMIRESTGTAVVLDYGVAATYEQDEEGHSVTRKDRVTSYGLIMGTPDYISPEAWDATTALDGRADVYALGAMIFYALERKTMWGIVQKSANDIPAFTRISECARQKPRPPITAEVPKGVKLLYTLATMADREARPWPEGFMKACEQLLATDGETLTLDERSKTVSVNVTSLGGGQAPAPSVDSVPAQTNQLTQQPVTPPISSEVLLRRPGLLVGAIVGIVVLSASIVGAVFWTLSKSSVSPSDALKRTAVEPVQAISSPETESAPSRKDSGARAHDHEADQPALPAVEDNSTASGQSSKPIAEKKRRPSNTKPEKRSAPTRLIGEVPGDL